MVSSASRAFPGRAGRLGRDRLTVPPPAEKIRSQISEGRVGQADSRDVLVGKAVFLHRTSCTYRRTLDGHPEQKLESPLQPVR